MGGDLLMADENMMDILRIVQGVIDRERRAARVAEEDLDTLPPERLHKRLRAIHLAGPHGRSWRF